jgi:hypothetical protein
LETSQITLPLIIVIVISISEMLFRNRQIVFVATITRSAFMNQHAEMPEAPGIASRIADKR